MAAVGNALSYKSTHGRAAQLVRQFAAGNPALRHADLNALVNVTMGSPPRWNTQEARHTSDRLVAASADHDRNVGRECASYVFAARNDRIASIAKTRASTPNTPLSCCRHTTAKTTEARAERNGVTLVRMGWILAATRLFSRSDAASAARRDARFARFAAFCRSRRAFRCPRGAPSALRHSRTSARPGDSGRLAARFARRAVRCFSIRASNCWSVSSEYFAPVTNTL